MNKFQRQKARIERDKNIKASRHKKKNSTYGTIENVLTYQNYLEALIKCRAGVNWKGSVQIYTQNAVIEIHSILSDLRNLKLPKLSSCRKIVLYE